MTTPRPPAAHRKGKSRAAGRQVSATRLIGAPAGAIFALLCDPAMHPLIDGSGSVRSVQAGGPQRLTPGARFGMHMKVGARYRILNTVVEYEEDHLIAWRHFNGHRWRWQLTPVRDHVTEVTETFDWSTARMPLLITASPFPHRNQRAIRQSLARLDDLLTGAPQLGACCQRQRGRGWVRPGLLPGPSRVTAEIRSRALRGW